MSIMLTGGGGYIGSHCYYELLDSFENEIIIVDNFSTGDRRALPSDAKVYNIDISNKDKLNEIFQNHKIETIFHFAGSLVVEESVYSPHLYYQNNVVNSLNLLELCVKYSVDNFIFSSTASVYGNNSKRVMRETDLTFPVNPYAESKLVVERMIKNFSQAYGLNYIILRYFNVAGGDPMLRVGQFSKKVTHLIKMTCELALGLRSEMFISGIDYDTRDGTCIRDYIHVSDLASAHVESYKYLLRQSENKVQEVFNCGYGQGYTVKEVLSAAEKLIGRKLNIKASVRRAGDPIALIADPSRLQTYTGWQPRLNSLDTILQTAIDWESKLIELDKKAKL